MLWRGWEQHTHMGDASAEGSCEMPIATAGSKVRGGRSMASQGRCYMAVVITLSSGSTLFS